ncbi:MAG: hypothetical protein LKF99_01165 [Bifidobacterium sp.]|jgi:hypothetical protein|nr:hypothetical protein [Bifidobacterium sp.]
MNWTDISSIVVGIAGIALSLVAVFQARKANKMAKNANELAETANREARAANKLAEDSNQISLDANTLSNRALKVGSDQTVYHWIPGIENGSVITIRNDCAREADEVSVFIESGRAAIGHGRFGHVAKFREVSIDLTGTMKKIVEQERARRSPAFRDMPVKIAAVIHVAWISELGVHRDETIKQTIDCP